MPLLASDAIVLHAFDYLESSRIVRLATREGGVRSALARGARRSQRRFGSALDLFAQGAVQLSTKPGRELDTMTAFDVMTSRPALARDLGRFAGASTIAELVLQLSTDHADPALFETIEAALDGIAGAEPARALDATLAGAWRVIAALGFTPSLTACAECQAPIDPDGDAIFSHAAGGVVCPRCAGLAPGGRRMPADARRALHVWMATRADVPLDAAAARAHQRLLREFLQHHVVDGRSLRAFELWERGHWSPG
ncbi:MAG: DNA repair protein RecO [Gemmatimonadaceae bacterium]